MALDVTCQACQVGAHNHHDGRGSAPDGLIGGEMCFCQGECRDPSSHRRSSSEPSLGDPFAGYRSTIKTEQPFPLPPPPTYEPSRPTLLNSKPPKFGKRFATDVRREPGHSVCVTVKLNNWFLHFVKLRTVNVQIDHTSREFILDHYARTLLRVKIN